ncbi:MAG: hypothetical protein MUC29_02795 [Pyrinomonadaceae bacterium]|jgi:hypothetical protein|nr:hypothetical protein [Pyrinomonadaceae bacterium]
MATLLVHDSRVIGNSPRGLADEVIQVNASTPLSTMISRVNTFHQRRGRITTLFILAHGSYQNFHADRFQMSFRTGGCGIQICHEGLTVGNLGVLSAWNGKIDRVKLFSCGIAAVTPQVRESSARMRAGSNGQMSTSLDGVNGEYFCQQFAEVCGAQVIASDTAQEYGRYRNPIDIYITGNQGDIDSQSLLDMEGNVRTFRPSR